MEASQRNDKYVSILLKSFDSIQCLFAHMCEWNINSLEKASLWESACPGGSVQWTDKINHEERVRGASVCSTVATIKKKVYVRISEDFDVTWLILSWNELFSFL